jgi:hypothetical protein
MGKNLTMLPKNGTRDRDLLEGEAIRIGLDALRREELNIPNALYAVHMAFRTRFIEQRGLMDVAPGVGDKWKEAIADARTLERHVCQQWATAILKTSESRR